MKYLPDLNGIASGSSFSSSPLSTALDDYAIAVNEINDSNFLALDDTDDSLRQITNRRIHKGALSETFRSGVLTPGEPACWVAVGRGGQAGVRSGDYSLGPQENQYTVDGCSVRVMTDRRCGIHVDSCIQIDAIKVANATFILDTTPTRTSFVDVELAFELRSAEPGGDRLSPTIHDRKTAIMRVLTVEQTGDPSATPPFTVLGYEGTVAAQRGFTVHLSGYYGLDPSGGVTGPVEPEARDFYVSLETTITGLGGQETGNTAGNLADHANELYTASWDGSIIYAHIKSLNRYTTARAFYVGDYPLAGSRYTHP